LLSGDRARAVLPRQPTAGDDNCFHGCEVTLGPDLAASAAEAALVSQ
jgi:hypothetical protein